MNKEKQKKLIIFSTIILALLAAPVAPAAWAQPISMLIDNENDLKAAILAAAPGETLYVSGMNITKEMDFTKDVNVTIASASGEKVIFKTSAPTAGTYPFNFNGANVNLTFNNIIIEGDGTHVLMRFQSAAEVTRKISGAVFRNGYRNGNGGALFIENGNIHVANCTFENNKSSRGAALYLGNNVKTGGNGDAVVEDCVFINNTADKFEGGAVSVRNDYNAQKGNLTVRNCYFENNTALGSGGAISGMGDIVVHNCKFVNNAAILGGAISAGGKKCDVIDSEVIGNRSTIDDATADLYRSYDFPCGGGGIYSSSAGITVINSKLNNNRATQDGGAICSSNGLVTLTGNVITGNRAEKDGGGVWIADLSMLASSGQVFMNNQASAGYFWRVQSPVDDAQTADAVLHGMKILNTAYTAPYTNAYSNYDVNYKTSVILTPYTVTYDGNGNDGGMAPADSNNPYLAGEVATVLMPSVAFSRSGFRFTGWNSKPDGSGDFYSYDDSAMSFGPSVFAMGLANVTLYAQWEAVLPAPSESPSNSPSPQVSGEVTPPTGESPEITDVAESPGAEVTSPATLEPTVSEPPSEYPPGYDLEQPDDKTINVVDPDGTTSGQWTENDGGWTYHPNPDVPQVIPREDGSFEVVNPDGTHDGLWSKNENDEWVYEEYNPGLMMWSWVGWIILALAVLLGCFYFIIIARRHITREEYVRMIVNAIGLRAEIDGVEAYEDVPEDYEYYPDIMTAKAEALLFRFTNRKFYPERAITREEIAGVNAGVTLYAKMPMPDKRIDLSAAFKDFNKINKLFLDDIQLTVDLELEKFGDKLKPNKRYYRKQAKKIVEKLLEVVSPCLAEDKSTDE